MGAASMPSLGGSPFPRLHVFRILSNLAVQEEVLVSYNPSCSPLPRDHGGAGRKLQCTGLQSLAQAVDWPHPDALGSTLSQLVSIYSGVIKGAS